MLTRRIIPCLDVRAGYVVKGVRFKDHKVVGDIAELATRYAQQGADELVFYDITASCDDRVVDKKWIKKLAQFLRIPFCVAGGIRSLQDAETILHFGADKISINSPALERPEFISECVAAFGQQCVVVGIDSVQIQSDYQVCQYTGNIDRSQQLSKRTVDWVREVEQRGAGEIVLNCMDQDGVRNGYDITQLNRIRAQTSLPLIASGGAGSYQDFADVFEQADVDGALAASVFHSGNITIPELKQFLSNRCEVRL